MYTTENSTFDATQLPVVNAAYRALVDEWTDETTAPEDRREIEKRAGDRINNAWYEGITVSELIAAARDGR